ncbi:Xan family putative trans-acting RiPP leader peptide [Myxococcus sp. RHSTA-1-4]|uniref:Xan family putative trans-acting RiPP leader peptide n=1 Tax=Myxococcus sp. RHSTA-1-4 TaxID=2874601 RepID=UPI00351D0533|nr:Xan family putative trans-acting RiPP leader peptide [Myxococcus sp. RHSTA-1-4]
MASEENVQSQATPSEQPMSSAPLATASEAAPAAAPEKLDEIEEIDFLLEEIESKIAPLALA